MCLFKKKLRNIVRWDEIWGVICRFPWNVWQTFYQYHTGAVSSIRSQWCMYTCGEYSIWICANRNRFNSLTPRADLKKKFRQVTFELILVIDGWGISSEVALRWLSLNFTGDTSRLFQQIAWCHQATSYCLLTKSIFYQIYVAYGVTKPKWVNCEMNGWSHTTGWT